MSATEATNARTTGADEVRQLARTFQYDRYIAALLLPRRHREALIVLAAFAGELQRIPFLVSEPMMAAIRFQWWRDELMAAAAPEAGERRTGHRLCDTLVTVARTYYLPFGLLQGIIDAAETEGTDGRPSRSARFCGRPACARSLNPKGPVMQWTVLRGIFKIQRRRQRFMVQGLQGFDHAGGTGGRQ